MYASRACQQRAYRTRLAARASTPADPPSVAGLLDAVRAVGLALDAAVPDPELVATLRHEIAGLLARLPTAADPGEDPGGPGESLTDLTATLAGGQQLLDTAATTLARHGRGHTLRRPDGAPAGTYRLLLTGGVYGGTVTRDHRGWTGWVPGPVPHRTRAHRTRGAAVTAILDAVDTHRRTRRRRRTPPTIVT
ncbi:hypothetical protein Ga0074812_14851 [Parafrankia irregularis]|uniref:Uncharacterized protein n=1 Tax=Parafrankia irregularis TaxID=795642 RepID=A0A0S4QZF7_9ACTN|nr:hypothetical protein Ga0074812_14851 [Parafrankia irregularis]